jgi:hypothetical protein
MRRVHVDQPEAARRKPTLEFGAIEALVVRKRSFVDGRQVERSPIETPAASGERFRRIGRNFAVVFVQTEVAGGRRIVGEKLLENALAQGREGDRERGCTRT